MSQRSFASPISHATHETAPAAPTPHDALQSSADMRFVRETLALSALLGQIALVRLHWNSLPAQIPTHFGFSGAPDAYGSKSSLLLLPIVSAVLYGILTVLSFFPQVFNYPVAVTRENRPRLEAISLALMGWLKVEIACLFAYLTWDTIRIAQGSLDGLGPAFLPILLVLLAATIAVGIVKMFRAR